MDPNTIVTLSEVSDKELIEQILNGKKSLFEPIIRRYNQRLYRIGMAILANDSDAEEAMQVAYIKAYENLRQWENRSTFGTWLTRIMLNVCLAQKKKEQRKDVNSAKLLEKSTIMHAPDQILVNKELSAALEGAISGLPDKYRLVFILREVEQLSVKETGVTLGIGEPNVKVRLNRAKSMLRENLQGYIKDHVYAFHLTRCDLMVQHVFARI